MRFDMRNICVSPARRGERGKAGSVQAGPKLPAPVDPGAGPVAFATCAAEASARFRGAAKNAAREKGSETRHAAGQSAGNAAREGGGNAAREKGRPGGRLAGSGGTGAEA